MIIEPASKDRVEEGEQFIERLLKILQNNDKVTVNIMYASLEDEIRAVLDRMKRQNREIERLILKDNGMKVTKCTGKSKSNKFDLRELNKRSK